MRLSNLHVGNLIGPHEVNEPGESSRNLENRFGLTVLLIIQRGVVQRDPSEVTFLTK